MFNILQIAGDQIIHSNNMISFFNKTITKMGPKKPAAPVISILFFDIACLFISY